MSKIKKVLALVLTMAMVLGMAVTSFAASDATLKKGTGTATDTGSITVNGIEKENGISVKAYKIIEAKYENGPKFSGYNSLYPTIVSNKDIVDGNWETSAKLASILDQIVANNTAGEDMTLTDTKNGDKDYYVASLSNVAVGSYLVVVSGADNKIYSPVVVSVSYASKDNGTDIGIDEGTVNIESGNAWIKVSTNPVLDKKIVEGANKVSHNTANIGDEVSYELTTTIPYYGGNHPVFNIVDTLDGLTYKAGSLEVKADGVKLEKGTVYTLDPADNQIASTMTINFVIKGNYTLNSYQGKTLTITYKATVNDNAHINQDANTNTATLNYTKDSKVTGKDASDTKKTYTYTYDIDAAVDGSVTDNIITKYGVDSSTSKVKLPGAIFTLYTDSTCNTVYTNHVFGGTVTTDNNGRMPIKGLEGNKTYYLKETKAPDNYTLNNTVYTITINEEDYDTQGRVTKWSITVNGDTIANQDGIKSEFNITYAEDAATVTPDKHEAEIINTQISSLPSTGGIGTTIFTIGGCAIMIVAAGLFFATRRKTQK